MKIIHNAIRILTLCLLFSFQSAFGQCDSSFKFTRAGGHRVDINPGAGHNINELYDPANGFTWESWVYLADTNYEQTVLIGVGDAVICEDIFVGLGWNGPTTKSQLLFMVRDINYCAGNQLTGSTRLNPHTWYHVAAVCDYTGGNLYLYLNGVNIGTTPITILAAKRLSRNITTALGCFATTTTNSYNGNIDEVKFWSGARTAAQIAGDMAGCMPIPQPGLLAYFKAKEGTGTYTMSWLNNNFSGNNLAAWGMNAPVGTCEPTASITSSDVVKCDTATDSSSVTISVNGLPGGYPWSVTMSDGSVISGTADASGSGTGSYNVLPAGSTTYSISSGLPGFPCASFTGAMNVSYVSCCPCEMRLSEYGSTTDFVDGTINGTFHLSGGSKKVASIELSVPYFNYDLKASGCSFNCADLVTGYALGNLITPDPVAGASPEFAGCFGERFAREVDWHYLPGSNIDENIRFTISIPKTDCPIAYDYCVKVIVRYTDCTMCECTICFSGDKVVCSCDQPKPKQQQPARKTTSLSKENVTIYPNPNGGQFTVSMDKTIDAKQITVMDMNGRIVTKSVVDGDVSKFDISHVAAGVYNVIITGSGNVVTRRVVINE